MYWKIKRYLLFDIESTVIFEPGIDACFRTYLREDDIIGMRISIEHIYRVRIGIAADIIANWTKLLLFKSIAYPDWAKCLGILRRIEAIKVIELIIEMRTSRVKPSQNGHCFVCRARHIAGINRALKQGLSRVPLELIKVNQVA